MPRTAFLERNLKAAKNLTKYNSHITKRHRNMLNQHGSGLLWFTGFSGAGKSTIAHGVEQELFKRGIRSYVLDGDMVRHGVNGDLGFSREERKENIRRIIEISKLFVDAGLIVLGSFISPFKDDRDFIRKSFAGENYYEIYIKCSIRECEKRDPKGIYKKVRQGMIPDFTGISAPYEEPEAPDLIVDTEARDINESVQLVLNFIDQTEILNIDNSDDWYSYYR